MSGHIKLTFRYNGRDTAIRTRVRQGVSDRLLSIMAEQLDLSRQQFDDLVDYRLDGQAPLRPLRRVGHPLTEGNVVPAKAESRWIFRGRSHPDTFGRCLPDERVSAPDRFGELFPGAADRFAWEIEPPGLVEPVTNVPGEIAPLVEVPMGKRPVQDGGGDVPARPGARSLTCSITQRALASRHCRSSPRARYIPRHPPCRRTASGFLRRYPGNGS
ncbi:MAG TPA: hypothetical protein PLG75_10620 [Methanoculleus sp.]|nr:hypothetical protein [Methanoculleus sp.]